MSPRKYGGSEGEGGGGKGVSEVIKNSEFDLCFTRNMSANANGLLYFTPSGF